jgi:hypothetical protein
VWRLEKSGAIEAGLPEAMMSEYVIREISIGAPSEMLEDDPFWGDDDGTVYRLHYYPPKDEFWYLEMDGEQLKEGGQAFQTTYEEIVEEEGPVIADRLPVFNPGN